MTTLKACHKQAPGSACGRWCSKLHLRCLSWLHETRTQLTCSSCGLAAWFDLYDLSKLAVDMSDKQGIAEATNYLGQLVEEEIKAGIPADRIAVGGFSQVSTVDSYLDAERKLGKQPHPLLKL